MLRAQADFQWAAERREGKDCVTEWWGRRLVAYCWRPDKHIESVHLGGVGLT